MYLSSQEPLPEGSSFRSLLLSLSSPFPFLPLLSIPAQILSMFVLAPDSHSSQHPALPLILPTQLLSDPHCEFACFPGPYFKGMAIFLLVAPTPTAAPKICSVPELLLLPSPTLIR